MNSYNRFCFIKQLIFEFVYAITFDMNSFIFKECPENYFQCSNSRCVQTSNICDGNDDCGDNSDEILPCDGNNIITEYTIFIRIFISQTQHL